MIKYALVYHDRYIPLVRDNGTLEQAIEVALDAFWDGEVCEFDRDVDFEIVEITAHHKHNTGDHKAFFDAKVANDDAFRQAQKDAKDVAEYERLKAKFEEE